MIIGIAADNWKLPVFKERLAASGYVIKDESKLTKDATLMRVEVNEMAAGALKKLVESIQQECHKRRRELKRGR